MGFSSTATSTNLVAKLTPYGRQQLLASNSNIITHFGLGDSDANYNASLPLVSGEVPVAAGNQGKASNSNNSTALGYKPKSMLYANSLGSKKKLVNAGSTIVSNSQSLLGQVTITGDNLTFDKVDRNDVTTDSRVNWFYSFRLPINAADDNLFTSTPSGSGGFADTGLSALAQTEIVVIGVDSADYGEMFDGKSIHLAFTTSAASFNIYGTYEKTLTSVAVQDANYKETSFNSAVFGNNVVFLFSDDVQKPNNNAGKSWATGSGTVKPFSVNNKERFNLLSNSITSTVADICVGIAHLDDGIVVLTHPSITSAFTESDSGVTATSISFNSVVTEVTQEVVCVAEANEFATSNNPTWSSGDIPRISEVVLMDSAENIIAVAKTDRHIEKAPLSMLPIAMKITV